MFTPLADCLSEIFVGAFEWNAVSLGVVLEVLEDEELSGGDFVRNVKQLLDLLRQLADVAPNRQTASAAQRAADDLYRGVVAASSSVASDVEPET